MNAGWPPIPSLPGPTLAESFRNVPLGHIVQPCPTQTRTVPVYWIEIELIGEDEQPIPWESYELTLPDGTVVPGFLDDQGLARLDGIVAAGTCHVRFPALDSDAWVPVAAVANAALV